MILANRHVDVFDNKIENNQNAGVSISSYLVTQKPFKQDPVYDPYCEAIYIHDNHFAGNAEKPSGALGQMISMITGEKTLPDIVYGRRHRREQGRRRQAAAGVGDPHSQ